MMSDKYELEDAYLETLYDHDYFLAHGISKGSQILPQKIAQGFQKDEDKINAKRMREKDRSDRATHQQVLDQRTYLVLLKFFKGHLLGEVNGCISTGKEANVYHGATPDNEARAIKIYKTSILIFKDRDRYVSGEYRFKGGYNKQNPRQMVRVWAEKEFRNLMRLQTAGIRSPKPIAQRQHLLIMTPRLKDFVSQKNNTELTQSKLIDLYWEAVKIMHQMTPIRY
ncbi:MAG: putative Serine/threonine-protein kinase rio1 [Streblomastix strix]|uniref:Serine/threonine-protein kinase RIO1 n=1 Tax=Streblomastix strix TaxID=222440 RepID=A0A5J4WT07_9EUKA|nr:MAG: putative Serine/threonine-protein kinase rio1 [Streblomastix strix]